MDHKYTQYTIDRLLQLVASGRLGIPNFQRDFVWTPDAVAELLDSVARGWPIGSILLLEGPAELEAKGIEEGPKIGSSVALYVLDGQQRITALFHALNNVSDHCYFVDFAALERGDDDFVQHERRVVFETRYREQSARARDGIALVHEVYRPELFYSWLTNLSGQAAGVRLNTLREQLIPGLRSRVSSIPTVCLDPGIEMTALARIFETINRTGMDLRIFDLMIAKMFYEKFNLREQWEEALRIHPLLDQYKVDGIEVLKLIALLERVRQRRNDEKVTVKGVRQGDVLALKASKVRAQWSTAIESYEKALQTARSALGASHVSIIPSVSMLLPLAVFHTETCPDANLSDWYWRSVANQSYAQGANTRVIKDVDDFIRSGVPSFDVVGQLDSSRLRDVLLEPVRSNGVLARGIASLLVLIGALDPLTGAELSTSESILLTSVSRLKSGRTTSDTSSPIAEIVLLSGVGAKKFREQLRAKGNVDQLMLEKATLSQLLPKDTWSVSAHESGKQAANHERADLLAKLLWAHFVDRVNA